MTPHQFRTRVYYEDTDLAGIVYYANYLKFIERARTEWVASLGIDQMALRAVHGIVFAVRRVEADYLRPARFGDELVVETVLTAIGGARLVLEQVVLARGRADVCGGGDAGLPVGGRPCRRGCRRRCGRGWRGRCIEYSKRRSPAAGLEPPAGIFERKEYSGAGLTARRPSEGAAASLMQRIPAGHRVVLAFPLQS